MTDQVNRIGREPKCPISAFVGLPTVMLSTVLSVYSGLADLHLYEDFGTHCMRHLRGEFAFVLWDETNQLLLAARDRFGIKPLYYAVRDDTLYLASEVKALFAAGVPSRWDQESFYHRPAAPPAARRPPRQPRACRHCRESIASAAPQRLDSPAPPPCARAGSAPAGRISQRACAAALRGSYATYLAAVTWTVVAASKMVTFDGCFCGTTKVCLYSTVVGVTCWGSIPVGGTNGEDQ
jgi:hypothetical protein